MQLNQLKPKHRPKEKKRVGRGGKRGTYSGRGQKGQKARSGRKFQPVVRYLIKRYPKLRGYRYKKLKTNLAIIIINVEILEKSFENGSTINPRILVEKKLIRKIKGRVPAVKILGRGELTKNLIVEGCLVSKSTKEEIEKAGGVVK